MTKFSYSKHPYWNSDWFVSLWSCLWCTCVDILTVCQAMECYSQAAILNHARSAYNLAILHLQSASNSSTDEQLQEATRLLEQAAGLGLKEVFFY